MDLQDGYYKIIEVDMDEMDDLSPTMVEFMEHLFKYELGDGAKTGLKSADFHEEEVVDEAAAEDEATMDVTPSVASVPVVLFVASGL